MCWVDPKTAQILNVDGSRSTWDFEIKQKQKHGLPLYITKAWSVFLNRCSLQLHAAPAVLPVRLGTESPLRLRAHFRTPTSSLRFHVVYKNKPFFSPPCNLEVCVAL